MRNKRTRMIVDLPAEAQMAIKLRAVKSNSTTGQVVYEMVQKVLGKDLQDAKISLASKTKKSRAPRKEQP